MGECVLSLLLAKAPLSAHKYDITTKDTLNSISSSKYPKFASQFPTRAGPSRKVSIWACCIKNRVTCSFTSRILRALLSLAMKNFAIDQDKTRLAARASTAMSDQDKCCYMGVEEHIHSFRNFFNLNATCKPFFTLKWNLSNVVSHLSFLTFCFDFLLLFEHANILKSIGSKKLYEIWFPK